MARAPVDLPEREPLRGGGRGVERDRTGDEGQLQIALPVGAGCRHGNSNARVAQIPRACSPRNIPSQRPEAARVSARELVLGRISSSAARAAGAAEVAFKLGNQILTNSPTIVRNE